VGLVENAAQGVDWDCQASYELDMAALLAGFNKAGRLKPALDLAPAVQLRADACITRDSKRQLWFQILAAVHGNRNDLALAGLGVDMVTSVNPPE
jgi:hypothetical protein